MVRVSLLATAALAAPAALAATPSSSCPYNYPQTVNTTESGNGLVFTIASTNPATNDRAVQLRPNPNLVGAFYTGVDATSAVLLGNLNDGGVYSQARDEMSQLYGLGPTAYLNTRQEQGTSTQYTVGFANATQWPGTVDANWTLQAVGNDGTYSLYHNEGSGIANGFMLCLADFDTAPGQWYQLLYETYTGTPGNYSGCEYVSVHTTVAPIILNGACEIGAYSS